MVPSCLATLANMPCSKPPSVAPSAGQQNLLSLDEEECRAGVSLHAARYEEHNAPLLFPCGCSFLIRMTDPAVQVWPWLSEVPLPVNELNTNPVVNSCPCLPPNSGSDTARSTTTHRGEEAFAPWPVVIHCCWATLLLRWPSCSCATVSHAKHTSEVLYDHGSTTSALNSPQIKELELK